MTSDTESSEEEWEEVEESKNLENDAGPSENVEVRTVDLYVYCSDC